MIEEINPLKIAFCKYLHDALYFNSGVESKKTNEERIEELININRTLDENDNLQCPLSKLISKEILELTLNDNLNLKPPKKKLKFTSSLSSNKLEMEKIIDLSIWDKPLNTELIKPAKIESSDSLLNKIASLENKPQLKPNINSTNIIKDFDNSENGCKIYNEKRKFQQSKLEYVKSIIL